MLSNAEKFYQGDSMPIKIEMSNESATFQQ